ncbi:TVP38/TMEM64 family inner membrane protein YdjZ [Clostridium liquoris]|jgi:uncharacterized membrane protein YdjX (TVP38/TMEM64 family)|uniref:TVP38/TMEM64 family membrane protein n=1 Tax=Clostridium liquoris TaxID=1289519 RepID=A0A2T0B592_9CLOT|nr:TVP38/TMEM64 family protein [Clostridium liquoris]PRR79046.1 TVP38/TMEM64 family inner membrane protein YdjZ [Clostridium liquoris]
MIRRLWHKSKYFFGKLNNYLSKYKGYIILAIFSLVFIYIGYEYFLKYFSILRDPNKIKSAIMAYGKYSVFAFLVLQIIQVIVFFIPGEIIQVAGGYIFGTIYGSIISLIGITLGGIIVYLISSLYGKPFVRKVISQKQLKFFNKILRFGSINYVVFLLYLIPGIPKDALAYICGISDIKFKNFVIYSTAGRVPCIFISAYFGAKITSGDVSVLITIAVVMTILFVIGVLKGEKIIRNLLGKGNDS